MPTERIDHPDDPRIAGYRNVPDPVLLRDRGLFVAEGRLVVRALLDEPRHAVHSVLVTPAALASLADALDRRPEVPVLVAPLDLLSDIVGFNIHRGCLALGARLRPLDVEEALAAAGASPLALILEHLSNADNVGAVFRSARAFGAGCVLMSPGCCDPLYRKAIRVSMGATLRVPFAEIADWPAGLARVRAAGFHLVALTPKADAEELGTFAASQPRRIAILLGHEGQGLTDAAMTEADRRVRIAMHSDVDSINVSAAAAVAMYVCYQGLEARG